MAKKAQSLITGVRSKINGTDGFLNSNLKLQERWLKRASAVVVDYFIVLIATGILLANAHFFEFVLASGAISLVYFSLMEAQFGYTLGKKLFSLQVVNFYKEKPTLKTSLIRNLTKFNVVLLLADTILGFKSKLQQKYVDKIAKTNVIEILIPQQKPTAKIIHYEEPTKLS